MIINSEHAYAYATMSRIELKRHNDNLGLELTEKAYNLNRSDPFLAANMAMAYHFNGMINEMNGRFAGDS